jgi:hypothetical protein
MDTCNLSLLYSKFHIEKGLIFASKQNFLIRQLYHQTLLSSKLGCSEQQNPDKLFSYNLSEVVSVETSNNEVLIPSCKKIDSEQQSV